MTSKASENAAQRPVHGTGLLKNPSDDIAPATSFRPIDLIVFAVLWIPYAALVRRFWFVTDDAYISFRYSKNLALGHGLRYNLGDHTPVEGYSNFLWVIICGIFEYFEMSIEFWPLLLSAACGSLLMWLIFRTIRMRLQASLPIAAAATLIWALHAPVAVYSTSGLATMPFTLLLFVTFERLILRRGAIAPIGAGLAALALALLRAEGLYWAILLILMAGFSRWMAKEKFLKPLLIVFGTLAVGYGLYFMWRYHYYGLPLPNTVYAKAGISAKRLVRGLDYVTVNVLTQLTPLLVIPASLFILRRKRLAIGLPIVAMSFAFYAYAILVSGDFMAMGRFLAPGWAFTTLLLAWILAGLAGRSAARHAIALPICAAIIVIGLLPSFDVHIVPHTFRQRFHFRHNRSAEEYSSEYSKWQCQKENAIHWGVRGRALNRWLPPDAQLVLGAIGAAGYYSELFFYDRNGLVNHEVAILPADDSRMRSPGHDKSVDFRFFLEHKPDLIDVGLTQKLRLGLLRGWRRRLRAMADRLHEQYVVDFKPLPDWEQGGPNQHILMWRRIPDDVSPDAAWADFWRRALLFRNGIDEYRKVMEDGYPRRRASGFGIG